MFHDLMASMISKEVTLGNIEFYGYANIYVVFFTGSSSGESSADGCYKSLSVLLPLSLLVVLLLVAVLMACCFFRKLTAGPVVKPSL